MSQTGERGSTPHTYGLAHRAATGLEQHGKVELAKHAMTHKEAQYFRS